MNKKIPPTPAPAHFLKLKPRFQRPCAQQKLKLQPRCQDRSARNSAIQARDTNNSDVILCSKFNEDVAQSAHSLQSKLCTACLRTILVSKYFDTKTFSASLHCFAKNFYRMGLSGVMQHVPHLRRKHTQKLPKGSHFPF